MNYGLGNLFSLRAALRREGVQTFLTDGRQGMNDADALVLPGVGGFRAAAERIPADDLRDYVRSGKSLVGICLGMQLMLESSDEGPGRGLGLIPGRVKRLPKSIKVPQIGWNTVSVKRRTELTEGLGARTWVYYIHSYYPDTKGPWVLATSKYGVEYPCLIQKGNLIGTQFHPEKSGRPGSMILRNILRMVA